MATVKEWLDEAGFDWKRGHVIVHRLKPEPSSGWSSPGWAHPSDVLSREPVGPEDPLLNEEFDTGHGGPGAPRFVAIEPGRRVMFPWQYDGETGLTVVRLRPEDYLGEGSETPYPGC